MEKERLGRGEGYTGERQKDATLLMHNYPLNQNLCQLIDSLLRLPSASFLPHDKSPVFIPSFIQRLPSRLV
jgi:hypothetical protein